MTIFAVFFVGAQALERLLEPVALLLQLGTAERTTATDTAREVNKSAADTTRFDIDDALRRAADAKAADQKKTAEKTILFWAIASSLAAVASGACGFYFLSTVGVHVPQLWMEVLGTSLILGAGTKPLHDLIGLIETKKQSASAEAIS